MTKTKPICHYELLCLLEEREVKAIAYEYYTVLGLKKENNPSSQEIKEAYHQMTLKWHPDKVQQREGRQPNSFEKSKWHEIEEVYGVLSDSKKREKYDLYEGKNKYEKLIIDIENMIGKENVKVEERPDLKPVYKINGLDSGTYILINFTAKRKVIPELEKNILSPIAIKEFLKRYILLNLTTESKKTNKTKLKEKNVE